MSLKALESFRTLEDQDFKILSILERLLITHQFPPKSTLLKGCLTFQSENQFEKSLRRLNKLKYLTFTEKPGYRAVLLQFTGYDALALYALANSEILDSVGGVIGRGKESDVFAGISKGREVVLKIHRLGKGFKKTRRARGYLGEKMHHSRLYESRLAASREFEALQRVRNPPELSVPIPIGHNRHIIVMSRVEGDELINVKTLVIETAQEILDEINEQIQLMVEKHKIIHGDLSAYNIILTRDDLRPVIIDWPQFEDVFHPEAHRLLQRDIQNIFGFFEKRFKLIGPDPELFTSLIPGK